MGCRRKRVPGRKVGTTPSGETFPGHTNVYMEMTMRTLLLAATALAVAAPASLSAQSANSANAANHPAPATTTVTPNPGSAATVTHNADGTTTVTTHPGAPAVVTHDNPGNLTPAPQSAMNKTYPVCRGAVQDNCQNPGEGGAPGRSRALGYWPGEPASERSARTDNGG